MNFPSELQAVGIIPVPTPAIIAAQLSAEPAPPGLDPHDLRAISQWAEVNLAAALADKIKTAYHPSNPLTLEWDLETEVDDTNRPYEVLSLEISGAAIGQSFTLFINCGDDLYNQDDEDMAALLVALNLITVGAEASEEEQSEQALSAWETMAPGDPALVGLRSWVDSAIEFARAVRDLSGTMPLPMALGEQPGAQLTS